MATQRSSESKSGGRSMPADMANGGKSEEGSQPQKSPRRRNTPRSGAGESKAQESGRRAEVSNEARYLMIQEAAYLRAERRGFQPGFELDDWLAAENEVNTLLGLARGASPAQ